MLGKMHNPEEWVEDLTLGRLLDAKVVAAPLTPARLEVLGAHLRKRDSFLVGDSQDPVGQSAAGC
jgi:hypothetical protein